MWRSASGRAAQPRRPPAEILGETLFQPAKLKLTGRFSAAEKRKKSVATAPMKKALS